MPNEVALLNQMIRAAAKVPLRDNYGKMTVDLTEPSHPTSHVTIRGLPEDTVVIRADAFRSPDTVFEGTNGECKRCDFLIVAEDGNRKVILYIEMKAGKASKKEIIQQLKGARCFVVYCREIAKEFWNQRHFLGDYQERYILLGHTEFVSLQKKPTRHRRDEAKHDRPEQFMKVDWPHHLQFKHLAS